MSRDDSKPVRRHKREEGQAMVEFALILPLFLVLVVGIIQFGIGLNYWLDLQRIANQGARWAVVNKFPADPDLAGPARGMEATDQCFSDPTKVCTLTTLQEYLKSERVSGGLDPCVVVTFPATTNNVGDPVKVELAAPFTFLPILDLGTITLAADATMRLEQKPGRIASGLDTTTC